MNQLLADSFASANSLLACLLVFFGVWFGWEDLSTRVGSTEGGLFLGFLLGCILAVSICGFIAQISDIRALLKDIRDQGQPKEDLLNPKIDENDLLPAFRDDRP